MMVFLPPKKNCKNNRRLSLHLNLHNLYSSICTFFIHVASNYQNTQFLLLSSSQEIRVNFPLTVFHKHDQLNFFKASDSTYDYLPSVFPENFWIS